MLYVALSQIRDNLRILSPNSLTRNVVYPEVLDDKPRIEGTFTCLRAEFILYRNYGFYISQLYVPTILIVVLSWVSFWLDIDSVPARVTLGILTVLTMTTQARGTGSYLPHVSYIKAIDVWMATCMFFVFAAVLEFAYVNVNSRFSSRPLNLHDVKLDSQSGRKGVVLSSNPSPIMPGNPSSQTLGNLNQYESNNNADMGVTRSKSIFSLAVIGREKARQLDQVSRCVFPLAFVVFNICYWAIYITWEPGSHDSNPRPSLVIQ